MNAILEFSRNIASLIYPMQCAVCRKALPSGSRTGVCAFCMAAMKRNPAPYCDICGHSMHNGGHHLCVDCFKKKPAFAISRSAFIYDGAAKELVHLFKYRNRRSLASLLGGLMADFAEYDGSFSGHSEVVTCVPLHPGRLRGRDYNQSELLAGPIAERFSLDFKTCLKKTRRTRNQNELERQDRLDNLKGAFAIEHGAADSVGGRRILLVDDVMTTGATLDECSRTLLDAGAAEVRCLTFARGA
jgi:ComF family protein